MCQGAFQRLPSSDSNSTTIVIYPRLASRGKWGIRREWGLRSLVISYKYKRNWDKIPLLSSPPTLLHMEEKQLNSFLKKKGIISGKGCQGGRAIGALRCWWWRWKLVQTLQKIMGWFPLKLNGTPAVTQQFRRNSKAHICPPKTWTKMLFPLCVIDKNCKCLKCLSTVGWINCSIHTMKY